MHTTDPAGALAAERLNNRTAATRSNATFQQPLSGFPPQAIRVVELGLNVSRSAGRLRPIAEPAPATKHLTIDLDHTGAST
jgi:hypothetical protein